MMDVRIEAIRALAKVGDNRAAEDFTPLLNDESTRVRKEASIALKNVKDKTK
jgi:HEAT repeat protein